MPGWDIDRKRAVHKMSVMVELKNWYRGGVFEFVSIDWRLSYQMKNLHGL